MGKPSREAIIFLHIPKTGGSTLNEIIRSQYELSTVFQGGPYRIAESILQLKVREANKKHSIRAVCITHAPFGIHTYLPQAAVYVTLLREPWKRHVSDYFHAINNRDHSFYEAGQKGASLDEFTLYRIEEQKLTNAMTRLVSGIGAFSPFKKLPENALEVAKDNLGAHFAVAGLTERFDESLLLMQAHFGWKRIYYRRRNVRKNKPARIVYDPDVKGKFVEENEMDYRLYRFVGDRLDERIRKLGTPFQEKLARFQRWNGWYQRIRGFPSSIRGSITTTMERVS